MLKNDVLWPASKRYKSRSEWEPLGFFSESLCNATQFDLKLGFFSSTAINLLADGFATFLYNGGRMRMIINDILSSEDKTAIANGKSGKIPFYAFDIDNIESIKNTLSERDKHFFECLSWLIHNNRLDIVIIKPNDSEGIAHTKIGVFSDGLNKVAFEGSCNFSRTALIENHESISAFCDWDGESDKLRVTDIENDFQKTYSGKDESVDYINASAIRTRISSHFECKEIDKLLQDEEKIISRRITEGNVPISIVNALSRAHNKVSKIIDGINAKREETITVPQIEPTFPYGRPRDYQIDAYNKWRVSQRGLFAMATGTGKTLTSLNCLLNIYKKYKFYKAMILVPTITLVEQWEEECKKFHFNNIIKVFSKNPNWKREIDFIKAKEDLKFSQTEPSYIIIATYASFAIEGIFKDLVSFPKKAMKQILFIADEAHNMGSGKILDRIDGIKFLRRIGLSATPERYYDESGTKQIMNFFGCDNNYTFEYTMAEAIENKFLCRYYYYPHLIYLTESETEEYIKITNQLVKYYNFKDNSFGNGCSALTALLLKRKCVVHKAQNKEAIFKQIIEDRYAEKGNLKYTLVYVPEGNHPDDYKADIFDSREGIEKDNDSEHIIDTYTRIVQQISPTTTVRKFTSGIKERQQVLDDFANGNLEVLTSMKCLDEGVDVPRSELAIFCASTGNPRQFIQRRGRILRKHNEKPFAIIHDLVVAPHIDSSEECYNLERSLLKEELKRVKDFAQLSENANYAYTELEDILSYYELSIFN